MPESGVGGERSKARAAGLNPAGRCQISGHIDSFVTMRAKPLPREPTARSDMMLLRKQSKLVRLGTGAAQTHPGSR